MLSKPQVTIIQKLLDALENRAAPHLTGLQEQVPPVRLAEIRRAKNRLTYGEYGICKRCNLIIPAAQLMADPLCQECAACTKRKSMQETQARSGPVLRRPPGYAHPLPRDI
jgi:hypothetical protein